MILDEYIDVYITNRNISYYKEIGYDVSSGKYSTIKINDVNKNSSINVNVRCDICYTEKKLSVQKYYKSLLNSGYYSCKKCSHNKINYSKHGESIKFYKKIKYDNITNKIENDGVLTCNKCFSELDLKFFKKNKNGRYLKVCGECRKTDFKKYYNNLTSEEKRRRKRIYYRNSITQNLWRSLLRSYLFRKSLTKLDDTISILGYTSNDLRYHLESKFESWMDWSNYGILWQVDHIIPVSYFNDCTPICIVNSLNNLRPLDKSYNLSRGNKLDDDGLLLFNQFQTYIKEEYINIYKEKIK
jgi:hypothetical protein